MKLRKFENFGQKEQEFDVQDLGAQDAQEGQADAQAFAGEESQEEETLELDEVVDKILAAVEETQAQAQEGQDAQEGQEAQEGEDLRSKITAIISDFHNAQDVQESEEGQDAQEDSEISDIENGEAFDQDEEEEFHKFEGLKKFGNFKNI